MKTRNDLDKGLTGYGDRDFASYLRRSFAKSMGFPFDRAVAYSRYLETLRRMAPYLSARQQMSASSSMSDVR
jgi:hypothetical protein